MKKTAVIALTFVLIASLFAGCRRNVTPETSAPTTEPTKATTPPTTAATTPSTTATSPSGADGKMHDGIIDGKGDAGSGRRPAKMS